MRTFARPWLRRPQPLWAATLLAVLGATVIVRVDIAARRAALQAEARTAHRLLSQATSRLDAVLAMLALMARPNDAEAAGDVARLPALFPPVLAAWRRDESGSWPPEVAPALAAAEQRSLALPAAARHAALADIDAAAAQYTLVRSGPTASFALRIDARRLVRQDDWPWPADAPVRVTLAHGDRLIVLHDATAPPRRPLGLTDGFELAKTLDSASQPFVLHAQRFTGPAQWPWATLVTWAAACLALAWALQRWLLARAAQRQAADQTRLVLASRLNTMGELAAGIAHELNQPLTAVLAGTQAALRLLRDRGPHEAGDDTRRATEALELAVAQARRASDVLARLRRLVQPGGAAGPAVPIDLRAVARHVVGLMQPEFRAAGVTVSIDGEAPAARADPVAVEQILHNLLGNALQALRPRGGHGRIVVSLAAAGDRVRCAVRDDGPGVPAPALPRLFEPFFTTRVGGLGLGLPLCQTLATAMDGHVVLRETSPEGTAFELELPAADTGHPS